MASVNYYLRGKITDKESTIWVKFRDKDIDIRVPISYLTCKPCDWKFGKCKSASKKMFDTDSETVNTRLSQLEEKIIISYVQDAPEIDLKDWLKSIINPTNLKLENNVYSDEVVVFIDTYKALKKDTVAESTIKKANVIKNLLQRYIDYRKIVNQTYKGLRFNDLDNSFKNEFIKYCQQDNYKNSTTYKNLKFIKMICNVAQSLDIEVNKHVQTWKFDIEKVARNNPKSIYLSFDELEKIEKKIMPHDYLDNSKDWLIISCYTGQRVSDYMRFNSSMIVEEEDGAKFIEFTQQKTNAKMKIPLLKKVEDILKKRNGEFPRKISDVNYNIYIKEVCKIAEISEMIHNGKMQTIEKEDGTKISRKVYADFPKHELVTSHIGRKSFASNFYEKIPTAYLLNFTGHTTEKQLLIYINKTDAEKAKSTSMAFRNLGY